MTQEKIQQRMESEHLFQFQCYPGVSCFTQCCRDVTIVLTPYDVLRLKKALSLTSANFLEKYTLVIPKKNRLIPMVVLKMDEKDKTCLLVDEKGCRVYPDRPWPCRMYPLDRSDDGTYRIIADPSRCLGLREEREQQIREWLEEQGTGPYDEMNELFSEITLSLQAHQLDIDNPRIAQMVFMALYNLDRFRDFVFNSTFLDRFEIEEPERIEKIKQNDTELLKFAFDWLKFGLFGEKLFWVKEQPDKKGDQ
ncbi:MAG: YkgJ family cysteine cluster protein [Deltaproteobacteria bacterium]|nr:YkgJ family cysteine cluster protein [Deltaproteobacteria bacterium]